MGADIWKVRTGQTLDDDTIKSDAPNVYFRDSYNPTSLFHAVGLSWWRDVMDDGLVDEDQVMYADGAKRLLALLTERLPRIAAMEAVDGADIDRRYYADKAVRLMAMLVDVAAGRATLHCSL